MGAHIEIENERNNSGEPVGDIRVRYSELKATEITPKEVPALIDEIPLFAVAALFAEGESKVCGAKELRYKESDRIRAISHNLTAMGASIVEREDGFTIRGTQTLVGAKVSSFHDHRIAMATAVAALRARSPTEIFDSDCIGISFPQFPWLVKKLGGEICHIGAK